MPELTFYIQKQTQDFGAYNCKIFDISRILELYLLNKIQITRDKFTINITRKRTERLSTPPIITLPIITLPKIKFHHFL